LLFFFWFFGLFVCFFKKKMPPNIVVWDRRAFLAAPPFRAAPRDAVMLNTLCRAGGLSTINIPRLPQILAAGRAAVIADTLAAWDVQSWWPVFFSWLCFFGVPYSCIICGCLNI
jgi:hypothetical protein